MSMSFILSSEIQVQFQIFPLEKKKKVPVWKDVNGSSHVSTWDFKSNHSSSSELSKARKVCLLAFLRVRHTAPSPPSQGGCGSMVAPLASIFPLMLPFDSHFDFQTVSPTSLSLKEPAVILSTARRLPALFSQRRSTEGMASCLCSSRSTQSVG